MELERVVANLVERLDRHFFGKYQGFVVDNQDPEQLGRLKLRVPSVLGADVVTGWAMPCVPYGGSPDQGFLFIPEVAAGVWVEFQEGDLEFPIWVGTFWSKPNATSELPKPNKTDGTPDSGVQDPPTRKIIKTFKGHTLQFEDADNSEMILLVDGAHGHIVRLDKDGILIKDAAGNAIVTSASEFKITAKVPFTIDATGQTVTIVATAIDLQKA